MQGGSSGFHEVVVLVESEIGHDDAARLCALHDGVAAPVRYHVLLPVDDPARGVEGAMSSLSTGEVFVAPPVAASVAGEEMMRDELLAQCRDRVHGSVAALEATGARATGAPVCQEPVSALADRVAEVEAQEVVVLTRPHLVRELLHLDWTSRAERRLRVPVLHLLEQVPHGPRDADGPDGH